MTLTKFVLSIFSNLVKHSRFFWLTLRWFTIFLALFTLRLLILFGSRFRFTIFICFNFIGRFHLLLKQSFHLVFNFLFGLFIYDGHFIALIFRWWSSITEQRHKLLFLLWLWCGLWWWFNNFAKSSWGKTFCRFGLLDLLRCNQFFLT